MRLFFNRNDPAGRGAELGRPACALCREDKMGHSAADGRQEEGWRSQEEARHRRKLVLCGSRSGSLDTFLFISVLPLISQSEYFFDIFSIISPMHDFSTTKSIFNTEIQSCI